jgi:hypothetical protein
MPLTARDRRTLTIGGVIVGVLLVGFLLVNLLGGGGGNEAFPSFSFHPASPSTGPSATGSQQVPAPALAGRDPFSIPPGFGGATSTSTETSGPSGTSGTSSPPGTQTSTSAPTLPGGGSSSRIGGHTVVLESVFSEGGVQHAQVEVDGTVYTPPVGGRFANGQFRLLSTSGNCATMSFGEQSFTLCAQPQK